VVRGSDGLGDQHWEISNEEDGEASIEAADGRAGIDLTFVPVADKRVVKNRIHLDLRSSTLTDQADLVQRLMAMGATEIDIGQGDVPWAVLADPEDNEFCVIGPRR
jgi:glyoxalase superfamily protein